MRTHLAKFAVFCGGAILCFGFNATVYGGAADLSLENTGKNYFGVRYQALLAEDELSETGWLLLFGGNGFTKNGEYQPHFIDLMIKASWSQIHADGLCGRGFIAPQTTLDDFGIEFGLSDYEDWSVQDNDIAFWARDPEIFARRFSNIDSIDPIAADKLMAEYQVDQGGSLAGREIEVSLVRAEDTFLPRDQNYFMDPDLPPPNLCAPNSQADILYAHWIANLKVPSLGVDSSVDLYVNADQADKIAGSNTLNFLWESPSPAINTDKFRVIIFNPQVKLETGEWVNATKFYADYRGDFPVDGNGNLLAGYRRTTYQGRPAIEASFGYGQTDYVKDKNPNDYEQLPGDRGLIDLDLLPQEFSDLAVISVSGPKNGTVGASACISATVANQGAGPSGFFTTGMYLSTDSTITTADIFLGTVSFPDLASGQSTAASSCWPIPAGTVARTYTLGAIADYDDRVPESNEGNNWKPGGTIKVNGPDLVVTALSGPTGTLMMRSNVTLSYTVKNQGGTTAPPASLMFYLSPDAVIDTSDYLFMAGGTPDLASGATVSASANLDLPGIAGTYYFGAIADSVGQVAETVETNNSRASTGTISVAPVDLTMISITGPGSAGPVCTIPISDTVRNQGSGGIASFSVGYYLSTDSIYSSNDVRMGWREISNLGAGQDNTDTTNIQVPFNTTPGIYYLLAVADHFAQAQESDETNNVAVGNMITIDRADLVVLSVSGPASAVSGSPVNISDTVKNQGGGCSGSSHIHYFLSTDNVITTDDISIGGRGLAGLEAGVVGSASSIAIIPSWIPSGTYYLGAIVDLFRLVPESDETNNTFVGNPITITPGNRDLIMTQVSGPASAARGKNIAIANTVCNQGADSTVSFNVSLYLSTDAVYGGNDIALGSRTVAGLSGNQCDSANTTVMVPATQAIGTYYLLGFADSNQIVGEANENNNVLAGNQLTVTKK